MLFEGFEVLDSFRVDFFHFFLSFELEVGGGGS